MIVKDTRVVEIHGNDGASPLTAAKNHVQKTSPEATVLDARFGVGRCDHGYLLVEVEYEYESDEAPYVEDLK